jgi:hypothetical protein
MLAPLKLGNFRQYPRCLIGYGILFFVYITIFGWMLFAANGMPYVMDNNETYSSIVHAKSIHQFGLSSSKGLADETYSSSPEAHPYVHSHQGNYPRLFAWLIYELGATNTVLQILITTFTIGLAAILIAFAFISRIANSCFALIFCLVLISDYVFFSQWQVVTYRVWGTFVFFLQFFSIEQYLKKKNIRWALVVFINTTLFCYGELIFAAFLGLFSFFWLTFRGWRDRRQYFIGVFCLIAGLLLAISILIAQGISYLGFDNFVKDIKLTFFARNNFNLETLSLVEISNFYKEHNVVFWENLVSRNQFINFQMFFKSIFSSFIDVYSPIATFFLGILFLNYVISSHLQKIYHVLVKKFITLGGLSPTVVVVQKYLICSVTIIFLMYFGSIITTDYYGLFLNTWWFPMLAMEVVALIWILTALGGYTIFFFSISTFFILIIGIGLAYVTNTNFSQYWLSIHGTQIARNMIWLVPLFVMACTISFSERVVERGVLYVSIENQFRVPNIIIFMLFGLLTYSIVYFFSPGYIFSGYISRYAPFLVFVFNIFIAISFYQLIYFAYTNFFINSNSLSQPLRFISSYFVLTLICLVVSLWLGLQYSLVNKLPPTHYSVLERLGAAPFKDASFIVNTYAAPVAIQTGAWAYMDIEIGKAILIKVKGEDRLLGDKRYLWFADKNSNYDYRRPDYYICLLGRNISTVLEQIIHNNKYRGCLDFPLVKLAINSQYSNQELRVVEYDKLGEQQTGVASWAIVKFDWGGRLGNGLEWVEQSTVELSK